LTVAGTLDGDQASARRTVKSEAAFRTISEVAEELDVPQHVLRFWESRFNQIKPLKRGGGRRYYRPEDIQLLRRIRDLLYRDGYTIKGVQKVLREGGAQASALAADEADSLAQSVGFAETAFAPVPPLQSMPSPQPVRSSIPIQSSVPSQSAPVALPESLPLDAPYVAAEPMDFGPVEGESLDRGGENGAVSLIQDLKKRSELIDIVLELEVLQALLKKSFR